MGVELLAAISGRHCVRAFLDRAVPSDLVDHVLTAAAHAPSTRNIQPWRVEVVTGAARDELSRRLCEAHDTGVPARHDYVNRPDPLDEVSAARAREFGRGIYAVKQIERGDRLARGLHIRENYRFFGAPIEMIFHLPRNAVGGTFLDMGMFLGNVLTGLAALGLGSCPQYSVTAYSDIIRDVLALEPDRLVVCGLAVGYPDPAAPVNDFRPPRAPLAEYARWHGTTGDGG